MHVGLLESDQVPPNLRHLGGGYREMFEAFLRPQLPQLRFSYYDVCGGKLPAAADECDAYFCTGSRYSVYEPLDWIAALQAFVRALHEHRKPFVGICFGHQILAQALGGEVARAPQGWGVGVHEMAILRQEPWMRPQQARCSLQYMHADQVKRLPPQSVALARSEHCEVAMFRVGDSMLGIEGHPEFPAAYNEALIRSRAERIGAERAQAALAAVHRPTDAALVGRWIAAFLGAA
jgi:GMP synthase-like glutamine amidotransferase